MFNCIRVFAKKTEIKKIKKNRDLSERKKSETCVYYNFAQLLIFLPIDH